MPLNTSVQLNQHQLVLALCVCWYDIKHSKRSLRNGKMLKYVYRVLVYEVEVYYIKDTEYFLIKPSQFPILHNHLVHLHIWLLLKAICVFSGNHTYDIGIVSVTSENLQNSPSFSLVNY